MGALFGHPEFVVAQLEKSFQKQETFIRRIPLCQTFRLHGSFSVALRQCQGKEFTQMHDHCRSDSSSCSWFETTRMAGLLARWVDCLPMINACHLEVPESLLNWKEIQMGSVQPNRHTAGVRGFETTVEGIGRFAPRPTGEVGMATWGVLVQSG